MLVVVLGGLLPAGARPGPALPGDRGVPRLHRRSVGTARPSPVNERDLLLGVTGHADGLDRAQPGPPRRAGHGRGVDAGRPARPAAGPGRAARCCRRAGTPRWCCARRTATSSPATSWSPPGGWTAPASSSRWSTSPARVPAPAPGRCCSPVPWAVCSARCRRSSSCPRPTTTCCASAGARGSRPRCTSRST